MKKNKWTLENSLPPRVTPKRPRLGRKLPLSPERSGGTNHWALSLTLDQPAADFHYGHD